MINAWDSSLVSVTGFAKQEAQFIAGSLKCLLLQNALKKFGVIHQFNSPYTK